jgi:hypothetical protein
MTSIVRLLVVTAKAPLFSLITCQSNRAVKAQELRTCRINVHLPSDVLKVIDLTVVVSEVLENILKEANKTKILPKMYIQNAYPYFSFRTHWELSMKI